MAFGIWFGAVTFQMFGILTNTKLPLPDGERIVRIQNWDPRMLQNEDRVLYDYQAWRSARSITDLGAYRETSANLVGADSITQPAAAVEITASAFRIAPAHPLLGRVLDEADQRPGAAPVVLIGYDVWTTRFNRDPRIVGKSVRLGENFATVIGVMPAGYAFPRSHELWLPLNTNTAGVEPLNGTAIKVFGRLADGFTLATAQEELTALAKRLAAESPRTHAHLQPHVLPYAQLSFAKNDMLTMTALTYVFVVVLVVVVCSTVALLLFARAATRENEILVRTALGASRRRIVAQLFAEALVLSGVATVVGLVAAQVVLTRFGKPYLEVNFGRLPFWYDFTLAPTTVVYAIALALISAVVAGVMPARKITRGLGARLRVGTAGGGGVSFGGVWTAVIVVQVALTVTFPAAVMLVRSEVRRIASYDVGLASKEYLGVNIGFDGPAAETLTPAKADTLLQRFSASLDILRQRLEADPAVGGVTFVDRLPRDYHREVYLNVVSLPDNPPFVVSLASIDPSYFDVLHAPVLSGRAFTRADLLPEARVVIVDQGFVNLVMGGRNPIGHRMRLSGSRTPDSNAAPLPLYEVIGVVKELGMSQVAQRDLPAGVYLPIIPGRAGALNMIVHGRGDPLAAASRVRKLATVVDPSLRIEQITRLSEVATPFLWFLGLWERIIITLTGIALLLSLAGIYAVLSYTVARRTREIGVRVALGASTRRVITSVFKKPLTQVTVGVLAGTMLIAAAAYGLQSTEAFGDNQQRGFGAGDFATLTAYALVMLGICTLACIVPTVRALRVQPTEALRAD